MQTVADNIRQGHRFRLVVNAMHSFASTCMPAIVAETLSENADTILTAQPLTSDEIVTRLRDYECNFGIVETQSFPEGISSLYVHEEQAQCILPPGHELGAREIIAPEDFEGVVLIQLIAAAQLGEQASRMLIERDVKCHSIIECTLAYLIQKLVMEGVGVAITDPRTAWLHAQHGGLVRPLSVPLVSSISIITRDDTLLTHTEQKFVDKAIAWMADLKIKNEKAVLSARRASGGDHT